MTPTPSERERLRRYLLGRLSDDAREELEQELLAHEEIFQELLILEDEVVDEYLSGGLNEVERVAFETNFLTTPERYEKLRFGKAFSRYISSSADIVDDPLPQLKTKRRHAPRFPRFKISSPLNIAVLAIVIIAVAIGAWRIFLYESKVDQGLLALNDAYREQRPLQSRISSLSYAPYAQTRGGVDRVDSLALSRADAILSNAVLERPDAGAHHAIGEVYLAKKQFDLAIREFEEALKTDPRNPTISSDLGVALMELANTPSNPRNDGQNLEKLGLALHRFDTALQLNASSKEALYNRALLLQRMKSFAEAKKAWEQYLQVDSSSPWADEARTALKALGAVKNSPATAADVLAAFLQAHEHNDDNRAWTVLSQTREVVNGRMIPFQLINEYLKSSVANDQQTAARMLAALRYAGKLELKHSGDPYVTYLGEYYVRVTASQRDELSEAHRLFNDGLGAYVKSRYEDANNFFRQSRTRFHHAGDVAQEMLLSYWIANCETQNDHLKLSVRELEALVKFAQAHHFEWLKGQAFWLLASDRFQLGEYSRSIEIDRDAVIAAEQTADDYNRQKIFTQLANKYRQVRRPEEALSYHWRSLDLVGSEFGSTRQAWRTYVSVAETFFLLGNLSAATTYQKEALGLAESAIHDAGLLHSSYVQLAQIYRASKEYGLARKAIDLSLNQAQTIGDDQVSHKLVAYSRLQLGHINREEGKLSAAINDYDRALEFYEPMEFQLDLYDAHKGRLKCYVAERNDQAIERELRLVLDLFERYRRRIIDEQNRNSFFDAEQSLYELAIEYELSKGRDELALDYSETSRARSLLDSLQNKENRAKSHHAAHVPFQAITDAQTISQLRGQVPSGVQVVQYAVLEDRVAIWVLSHDNLSVVSQPVTRDELAEKVTRYARLITSHHPNQREELRQAASSLYDILIGPVAAKLSPGQPLCVIPDKVLFQLSYGSLWSARSGSYLIEQFPIFLSSSLNVLARCSRAEIEPAGSAETFLGIGNPSFNRDAHPDLDDLPDAEREVSEIAKDYSHPVSLIADAANKGAVTKFLDKADVVHFAAHYEIDASNSMRSGLLLAAPRGKRSDEDDALTAQDVLALNLRRPKLIVLSACDTNGEKYYGGEGVVGLATTFLAAGVPLVVASQWPVDSAATADLMITFHHYRKSGYSTIAALRQAQIDMAKRAESDGKGPYAWAGFAAIGGYGTF